MVKVFLFCCIVLFCMYSCANLKNTNNVYDSHISIADYGISNTFQSNIICVDSVNISKAVKCDINTMFTIYRVADIYDANIDISKYQYINQLNDTKEELYYIGSLYKKDDLQGLLFYRIQHINTYFIEKKIILVNTKAGEIKSVAHIAEQTELDGLSIYTYSIYNSNKKILRTKGHRIDLDSGKEVITRLRNLFKICDDGEISSDYSDLYLTDYTTPDEYPQFDGDLTEFINSNIKYPKNVSPVRSKEIVFIQLDIDTLGRTFNHHIVKGVHPIIDSEALRVARLITFKTPAIKNGKSMVFTMKVPFIFKKEERNNSKIAP